MLNIQTTDNKTQAGSQHDETNAGQPDGAGHAGRWAGGLITQEVRFLLSNGLHREKSQAGICKPRFNTERAAVLKCFKLE